MKKLVFLFRPSSSFVCFLRIYVQLKDVIRDQVGISQFDKGGAVPIILNWKPQFRSVNEIIQLAQERNDHNLTIYPPRQLYSGTGSEIIQSGVFKA